MLSSALLQFNMSSFFLFSLKLCYFLHVQSMVLSASSFWRIKFLFCQVSSSFGMRLSYIHLHIRELKTATNGTCNLLTCIFLDLVLLTKANVRSTIHYDLLFFNSFGEFFSYFHLPDLFFSLFFF